MFVSHLHSSPLSIYSTSARHLCLDTNKTARCHLYLANSSSVCIHPRSTNNPSACVLRPTRSLPPLYHPPPSTVRYSPSSAHSRLAHGACNFHVAPSSSFISVSLRIEPFHIHPFSFNSNGSRTSESARSFALSRARVGADEGERHPLKSSWEPITRVTQGRTHRVSTAPKILLRPRLIDRLKPKIMIVAARNESWKKGADGRLYAPVEGIKRLN